MTRCDWCTDEKIYQDYHDQEWGVPVTGDTELFELLTLEGAQAGLSWITVLKKREGYRDAFDNFDVHKISLYSEKKVEALMVNKNIIRNRLKIKSVIKNANSFLKIQEEFGSFSAYFWQFVNHAPVKNHFAEQSEVPVETEMSKKISKDLKIRGFSFVGPTIIYAYMQACGIVNDHLVKCHRY